MTKTYTSDSHRAELRQDGLLAVYSHEGPTVVETTFKDGNEHTEAATARDEGPLAELARTMARMPVFAATAADDEPGEFWLDIDCGFQRWEGLKPEHELREALCNCGFEDDEIEAMIAGCQDAPWSYCPRQG
ncbi:MAG: hypothetical protein DRN81_05140 [Thermoproteota archaeon]|nr:MAG: hypothetical protein DRN81_05140 [Candidatus Korarchaeota archaeon]